LPAREKYGGLLEAQLQAASAFIDREGPNVFSHRESQCEIISTW